MGENTYMYAQGKFPGTRLLTTLLKFCLILSGGEFTDPAHLSQGPIVLKYPTCC